MPGEDLRPLFDAIVDHVPPPRGNPEAPLQMLVANLDSSDYLGRIAIGRIFNGRVAVNDPIVVLKLDGATQPTRVTKLFAFEGLKRIEIADGRSPATSSALPGSRTSPSARRSRVPSTRSRFRRSPWTSRPCR